MPSSAPQSPDSSAPRRHMPVSLLCRVCGERFKHGEQAILLVDNSDRSEFSGKIVPAFSCTRNRTAVEAVDFLQTCPAHKFANCFECKETPPLYGVSIHQFCATIFMAEPEWSTIKVADLGAQGPKDALAETEKEKRARLLRGLWTLASFRTPWACMVDLCLQDDLIAQYGNAMSRHAAPCLGLPGLARLPMEIFSVIWQMSDSSPSRRAIKAYLLRLELEEARGKEVYSCSENVRLADVVSWKRSVGHLHHVNTSLRYTLPPLVKITIDCMGILEIERLAERPPPESRVTPDMSMPPKAYVIEDRRKDDNIDEPDLTDAQILRNEKRGIARPEKARKNTVNLTVVELAYGRLRLRLPENSIFAVWNSPSPPELKTIRFKSLRHMPRLVLPENDAQLISCDLDTCSGVTVVFVFSDIINIKFHTSMDHVSGTRDRSSTASCNLSGAYWAFVPIAPHDRITAIWLHPKKPNCFVFRRKLAGDVPIGAMVHPNWSIGALAHGTNITLVCNAPRLGRTIQILGASPPNGRRSPRPPVQLQPIATDEIYRLLFPNHRTLNRRERFWSTAPLGGIVRIRVLTVPLHGICIGLLFYYSNGAIRALGDCHPDKSIAKDFDSPSSICFRMAPFDCSMHDKHNHDLGVYFKVVEEHDVHPSHEEDDWVCKPLGSGMLDFYISPNFTYAMRFRQDWF